MKRENNNVGREYVVPFNGISAISKQRCNRCQAKILRWMDGPQGKYCWACSSMGTVTDHKSLEVIVTNKRVDLPKPVIHWEGTLTSQQAKLAECLCSETKENQLVHAVTGAGKTEMLYPVLEKYLSAYARVAFVAPRVDVVHEIAARLKPIFNVTQTTMTGEQKDTHQYGQLVFATIHQLFKFKDAFDLVIVDECDAFPVYRNSWLQGAITKALKRNGRLICLTATLPNDLHQQYGITKEHTLQLYCRFHGYPLPNLIIRYCRNWRRKFPKDALQVLKNQRSPILIFVPEIKDCVYVKNILESVLGQSIGIVYAGIENRSETIKRFKRGQTHYLVTTILLERGVTFPGIDVMIIGAESAIFSTASLIQIAGRCGRSIDRPTGYVYVYSAWKMRKITRAYSEIKRMKK